MAQETRSEQEYRRFLKRAGYTEADAKSIAADMVERDTSMTDRFIAHQAEQKKQGIVRRDY